MGREHMAISDVTHTVLWITSQYTVLVYSFTAEVLDPPNAVTLSSLNITYLIDDDVSYQIDLLSSRCGDSPTRKLLPLLLHNLNFATVMNHNINICVF